MQGSGFIAIARTMINMVFGKSSGKTSPQLTYSENGRCGYIYYQERFKEIPFYYEFGGGDCQLCISIPAIEKWEKETNTPLSRRDEILNFIGKTVIKDKYSFGRRYEIADNWINIY